MAPKTEYKFVILTWEHNFYCSAQDTTINQIYDVTQTFIRLFLTYGHNKKDYAFL